MRGLIFERTGAAGDVIAQVVGAACDDLLLLAVTVGVKLGAGVQQMSWKRVGAAMTDNGGGDARRRPREAETDLRLADVGSADARRVVAETPNRFCVLQAHAHTLYLQH